MKTFECGECHSQYNITVDDDKTHIDFQCINCSHIGTCELRWPEAKLTIELVPKTCWYSNVRSNVSKTDWDIIRKKVYVKAGYRCDICHGVGSRWPVECHEVWNYDDKNHIQTLESMIALCPSCHAVKHIGFTSVNGKYKSAIDHLVAVNRWSKKYAEQYVAKQFEVWEERSKHQWKLNIDCIKDYTMIEFTELNNEDSE